MDFIFPDWADVPDTIGALSTTRKGGVSRASYDDGAGGGGLNLGAHVADQPTDVRQNRALLRALLPAEPAWLSQIHGVKVVDAANIAGVPDADASITTQRGVVCVIQTADCLPVLFRDVTGTVIGAAHAGWRGLANGVLENTVISMRAAGAGEILAWMGPAIGPQKFEVGQDVVSAFVEHGTFPATAFKSLPDPSGKYLADIYLLARQRLRKIGVEKIYGGELCTVSDNQRFYSYRRDGITGRMASLIWIK